MSLIYEEYTGILRRAFFDVHNTVGLGRREEAYHQALRIWFAENSLPISSRVPHRLYLKSVEAHSLFPDFIGWDAFPIEIKALPRKLSGADWVQVRDYMKFRGDELGLLVNFGLDRVHIERITHTPKATTLKEDWSYWHGYNTSNDRDLGHTVREALRSVYAEHSTGYGLEVTSKLISCSLRLQSLNVQPNPTVKSFFREHVVNEGPLDCLIVNDRLLITFTALFDSNSFNIGRGLSFMKSLGLEWGIAANFGSFVAEFSGLRLGSSC